MGTASIPVALEQLKSEHAVARGHGVGILIWIHRNREPLNLADEVRPLLNDPDPAVRASSIQAVVEWDSADGDEVRGWLRDQDPRVVDVALRAIDWDRPEAARAVPDLLLLLESAHRQRLRAVLAALRARKNESRRAVSVILPLAAAPGEIDESPEQFGPTRRELIETLVSIGAGGEAIAGLLTPYLGDSHHGRWACSLLSRACPGYARHYAKYVLLPQLLPERPSIDPAVLAALAGIGPEAGDAVPALTRLIDEPDCSIALMAIDALAGVGPDGAARAVPYLVRHIENLDPAVPLVSLVEAVERVGPTVSAAVPGLVRLLESSHAAVQDSTDSGIEIDSFRWKVVVTLGRVGSGDPRALAALRSLLKAESWQDRGTAAGAIALRGAATPELLADLIGLLADGDAFVRASAALAIGALSGDRAMAVGPLSDLLEDSHAYVQTAAAISLGQIGSGAQDGVPALRNVRSQPINAYPNYRRVGTVWPWDLTPARLYERRSVAHAARLALMDIQGRGPE
jgi:HEAT repeat protein